jgi:hypothetical protein
VRLNAAFRAAADVYDGNNNYAAYLYANGNAVYVMTAGEDLIGVDEAVNGENSYIEGTSNLDNLYDNGIVSGYCPAGPIGCSYAFGAGRYENRIVAVVTDGTLTIGLKNAGTGCSNDWIGFDNFRLFYLGTADQAAEGITPTLDGMVARANTLLAYEADGGELFRARPNFSNELRTQLEAAVNKTATVATTEEKMELVAEFTSIFEAIYESKQAYVMLEATVETLLAQAYEDPTATEEERTDIQTVATNVMAKWVAGEYTTEQALSKEDVMQSAYCQRYLQGAPHQISGVWQLATAQDMQWFARCVNEMGDVYAQAAIVAPIDMSGIDWLPIGKVARPYAGKFNGGLYPLTNMNRPLFGTTNSANIQGIAILGGDFGGMADYAAHTGSIIGHATGKTVLTRSYSTANMSSGTGDCGGLIGKVAGSGTIKDCYFAGNLTAGWSAGCMIGSSDGSTIAEISNCYVDATNVTYKNGDAHGLVVGWLHDGLTSRIHNVYVIAAPELTNIMGHTDNAEAAAQACKALTAEEFASGAVAYSLNNGNTDTPVWFQTLGTDACPVLDSSHMIVILNEDGTYSYTVSGTQLKRFLADVFGNLFGGLPLIRDFVSRFTNGYDMEHYAYAAVNDLLSAAVELADLSGDLIQGKATGKDVAKASKDVLYAGGALFGIPVRNVYNFGSGISRRFGADFNGALYDTESYRDKLADAIECGDEDKIAKIVGLMLDEKVGIEDDEVRREMAALVSQGFDVIPSSVPSTITIDKVKYELDEEQKAAYEKVYYKANEKVAKLIQLPSYKLAAPEAKAKAINTLYGIYRELANETALSLDLETKKALFGKAFADKTESFALYVSVASLFESDKNKKGESISGTRKAKVQTYVSSLKLTAAEKYMIMGYLGYTNTNGKAQVRAYINRLDLTPSQKKKLLEFCGYE